MKKILTLILITISLSGFSQNSKWSVGGNFSSEIGYYFWGENLGTNLSKTSRYDVPTFNYTIGTSAEYMISKRVGFTFGLHYSTYGKHLKDLKLPQLNSDGSITHKIQNNYTRIHFVGIPWGFNFYPVIREKWNFFIKIGSDFDFPIIQSERRIQEYNGTIKKELEFMLVKKEFGLNVIVPRAVLTMGIDWKINLKSVVRFEPSYRISMAYTWRNDLLGSIYYKGGLNIAYIYNF